MWGKFLNSRPRMLTCAVFVVANLLVKHCLSIKQCEHRECEHFFQLLWEGAVWLLVVNGLVVPKPPSRVSAGMSVSGWNSTSENSVYITTFPCSWPRDHGGGRSYTRTCQNGRWIRFPRRWDGTQLAGQIGATYVTVWIKVHIYYRQFRQNIAYLLRKIWAVCHSQNVTFHNYSKLKNNGIPTWKTWELKRGNLNLLWKNVVCKMRYLS